MCFLTTFSFTPFAFFIFFRPALTIEYIFGLRHTHSAMDDPGRSSFILLKIFLFFFYGIKWVIFGIVACVVQILVSFHVFVNVLCFDFQDEAVRVCVQQLALKAVLFFKVVIEEVVHQDLAVVQDRHPSVHRFVKKKPALSHINSGQVV